MANTLSPLATAFLYAVTLAGACGLVETARDKMFGWHSDVANDMVEQAGGAGIAAYCVSRAARSPETK